MAAHDISYVRQALGPITPRACANGAESANFEIHFLPGKESLEKKKICCSGVDSNLCLMHCRPHAFATEPMGLWQLWTANLALILLTACCSEC